MQASDKKPPEQGCYLLGARELLAQSSVTSSSAGGGVDVAATKHCDTPSLSIGQYPCAAYLGHKALSGLILQRWMDLERILFSLDGAIK